MKDIAVVQVADSVVIEEPPESYEWLGWDGPDMSNLDHSVDVGFEDKLKSGKFFGQYAAWEFCGYVWWKPEQNQFACLVMRYHQKMETVYRDTCKEIMEYCCDKYGDA